MNSPDTTVSQDPVPGLAATRGSATTAAGVGTGGGAGTQLVTTHGHTTIADAVVAKVAGLAVRDVVGIHDFGASASRAFGAVSERIAGSRSTSTRGITVEVGERQAAVDLTIVVDYGAPIAPLARAVRSAVSSAVEHMTGLEVTEVNIHVADLHQPDDDQQRAPARTTSRVQ